MFKNKNKGFTLVELLITITVLAIISVPVGSILITTLRSYAIDRQLQEDQYNIRMALLSMTRDLHNLDADDVTETVDHQIGLAGDTDDKDGDGTAEIYRLRFSKGGAVYYYEVNTVDSKKTLQRMDSSGVPSPDGTGIAFIQVPINTLKVSLDPHKRFVTIQLTSGPDSDPSRTTVSTTISISRIPEPSPSPSPSPGP